MARDEMAEGEYFTQVEALVGAASALDPGAAKIAVLEEAVRVADTHNDIDLGFAVREELIHAATFGGRPDVSMVAFAWCLARYDKEPDRFDPSGLLWKYKWVLDAVAEYPQFSREQIESMLADMERRYKEAGSGMHPV
ncbi:MAG: hypothetical protein K2V38_02515, partial [Gemmataceae bacterium]|nr:hypothetical protein [Gemmataceae bacterium]